MKKDSQSLIAALSTGPVQQYLTDHEHSDLRDIILRNKEILGISSQKIFEQIAVRKKAKEKLPLYYHTSNIVYPPQENFEQSSSEKTAAFKSNLVAERLNTANSRGVDLTGGFGVDALFFSQKIQVFQFVEPDNSLLEIAKFNHHLLGATNIQYYNTTAEEYLHASSETFDFVYIDPSRRTAARKKVSGFDQSNPDIIKLAPSIMERATLLMIKASPLLDIQAGMSQLPSVRSVCVVSVNNECKELLFLCEKHYDSVPTIEAINLLNDQPPQTFGFSFPEERQVQTHIGEPSTYLYEPNASILKAGAFKSVAARYGLTKMHANTHLYSSDALLVDFPGRKFRIEAFLKADAADLRKHLPDGYANVVTRNYPLNADMLRKKLRVKDGGDKFVIAFTGQTRKYSVLASRA